MLIYKKTSLRLNIFYVSALWFAFIASAQAGFLITRADGVLLGHNLQLNADLDLNLNNDVEEALRNGISLTVVFDASLYRHRRILWDQGLGDWKLERQISFHALSGQYVVSALDSEEAENFYSLGDALKYMGTLKEVDLPLTKTATNNGDLRLNMRAELDIEALPTPLRPVAYASRAWHLNSGWTTWAIHP